MKFSCPGKIFIAGEYACIKGGPALVGTLNPAFTLEVTREPGFHPVPFANGSPAGIFLSHCRESLEGVRLHWRDPHESPLGVGSSSAQFLLSVAAVSELRGRGHPSAAELLALYWETVGNSQGLRPSGVDVVAQWLGGPVVVRNHPFEAHKIVDWTGDAAFVVAFTGTKAKTHEHLTTLHGQGFPSSFAATLDTLGALALEAVDAWEASDAPELGRLLSEYQRALLQGGLAPAEFSQEVAKAARIPGVLGCKGSGAQGGDCVILLVESHSLDSACDGLRALGWTPFRPGWSSNGLIFQD